MPTPGGRITPTRDRPSNLDAFLALPWWGRALAGLVLFLGMRMAAAALQRSPFTVFAASLIRDLSAFALALFALLALVGLLQEVVAKRRTVNAPNCGRARTARDRSGDARTFRRGADRRCRLHGSATEWRSAGRPRHATVGARQRQRQRPPPIGNGLEAHQRPRKSPLMTRHGGLLWTWGKSLILFRSQWSGREDSNFRPPAPHAGALPGCATPRLTENEKCSRSVFAQARQNAQNVPRGPWHLRATYPAKHRVRS